MAQAAEVIIPAHAHLGEGAMWNADDKVLWWLDILGKQLHVYDPATDKDVVYALPQITGLGRLDQGRGLTHQRL